MIKIFVDCAKLRFFFVTAKYFRLIFPASSEKKKYRFAM